MMFIAGCKYCLKVYAFFGLIAQSASSACIEHDPPPPYDECVSLNHPPYASPAREITARFCVQEHEAIVLFKSDGGLLYEVCWETYGLMYNGGTSAEAVLERNLLGGDSSGCFRILGGELGCLVQYDLMTCVKKGIYIHHNATRARPLGVPQVAAMSAGSGYKQWEVLGVGVGYQDDLIPGEFRVLFSKGGYSCWPAPDARSGNTGYASDTLRRTQVMTERTPAFLERLRFLAQDALCELQTVAVQRGEKVRVRYIDEHCCAHGVVWDAFGVRDRCGRSVCDLLHDGVMQGTNLGYVGEDEKRHFAFISEGICKMLKTSLVKAIKSGAHLEHLFGELPLQPKHVRSMPHMSWTVVPDGLLKCCNVPYTWSLTFSGVALEGIPLHQQGPFMHGVFHGYLMPRNYLWALDFEELRKERDRQGLTDWYGARIRSKRMDWQV